MCVDYEEGGLGTKSLICLNEASNLKMCWNLLQSDEQWAIILRNRVLRNGGHIRHHIFSSIWSSIKMEYQNIMDNSTWLVGDGKKINFWLDSWCGESLAQTFNVSDQVIQQLPPKLHSYIQNHQWYILDYLLNLFPSLWFTVTQVTIPNHYQQDKLIWKHNTKGDLEMRDAYNYKKHHFPIVSWAKLIWSKDIPPSKSLLVWRCMLNKLPTDDNLITRGCHLPSICSLCFNHSESSFHLFFECSYAQKIWRWLASTINFNFQFQSIEEIWSLCNRAWSPQCKTVITAALVNLLNAIWYVRNHSRFRDKHIHWRSSISLIISSTSMSGNNTKAAASSSMSEFVIMKKFNVNIHPPNAPKIIEVIWHPPINNSIKCNSDGSSNSLTSSRGGIFRNSNVDFLLGFAENVGPENAFFAEIYGAMRAIDIAYQNNWRNLWFELDSALVVNAFKTFLLSPGS